MKKLKKIILFIFYAKGVDDVCLPLVAGSLKTFGALGRFNITVGCELAALGQLLNCFFGDAIKARKNYLKS